MRPNARMLIVGQNAAKRMQFGKRSERGQAPVNYPTQLFVDRGAALPAPLQLKGGTSYLALMWCEKVRIPQTA